jgi:hypothetical protein
MIEPENSMKNTLVKKNTCLLITPQSFYLYAKYFKNTLVSMGYEVTESNDEYPDNVLGKILGKLRITLLSAITRRTITKKFIIGKKYDLIIVIKGRGLSKALVSQMKSVCPKVIGYTFDSLKYHPAPLQWLKSMDKFSTFDYSDSEKARLPLIELFSSMPQNDLAKNILYDVSAIVRNHSVRLKFIDEIFSSLKIEKKFIYVYEQNVVSFILNFVRNPLLYIKYKKYIFFSPLNYEKYCSVLQTSNFTVDFAHPFQSGITMRCFEALNSQTKIITNNPNILRNEHFTSDNTIIYNENICNLKSQYQRIQNVFPKMYYRSLVDFIKQLIK